MVASPADGPSSSGGGGRADGPVLLLGAFPFFPGRIARRLRLRFLGASAGTSEGRIPGVSHVRDGVDNTIRTDRRLMYPSGLRRYPHP